MPEWAMRRCGILRRHAPQRLDCQAREQGDRQPEIQRQPRCLVGNQAVDDGNEKGIERQKAIGRRIALSHGLEEADAGQGRSFRPTSRRREAGRNTRRLLMAFATRARKQSWACVQQRGQRFPVTAKPGEQHYAQQQENRSRGQHRPTATNRQARSRADSRARRRMRRQPAQRSEEPRSPCMRASARRRRQPAPPAAAERLCMRANRPGSIQTWRRQKGLMNEIPVVVDGQRSARKQQRGDQARHKAEHLNRRAKKQNRDRSGQPPPSGAIPIP
jgi:hypothetical protein